VFGDQEAGGAGLAGEGDEDCDGRESVTERPHGTPPETGTRVARTDPIIRRARRPPRWDAPAMLRRGYGLPGAPCGFPGPGFAAREDASGSRKHVRPW